MEDCISQASSLTIYVGWGSWALLIVALLWMVQVGKSRRNIFSMALIVVAHPMLWGRASIPCTTQLQHSLILFFGLGIAVIFWDRLRPIDEFSHTK
jgi:hypothetical protein